MYYYWAYGLKILTDIQFPELFEIPAFGDPDAELLTGKAPLTLSGEATYQSTHLIVSSKEYLLHIDDIASYYVYSGNKIIVDKSLKSDWDTVRLFCLSNAFAALLHQRNLIPLHCSAFIDRDELVLVMGDSGAGKSTTLASLINIGFLPFSDDVCVPDPNKHSDEIFLYSSYPMMKYWDDTYDKVDIEHGKKDKRIKPDIQKYGVYFHERFNCQSKKVKLILVMVKSADMDNLNIKEINGIDLFQELERNAYRGELLGIEGLRKEHFIFFSNLANNVKTFLISRPANKNTISDVVKIIVDILGKN